MSVSAIPVPDSPQRKSETSTCRSRRLVCYADKFFSKTPGRLTEEKPLEKVRAQMERFGTASLDRFDALHREFG